MNTLKRFNPTQLQTASVLTCPRWLAALQRVRQSGGFYLTVSDQEILAAIPELGSVDFCRTSRRHSLCRLVKAIHDHQIDPADPVLVMSTGSGLKDIKAAMQAVPAAPIIEPGLSNLKEILNV